MIANSNFPVLKVGLGFRVHVVHPHQNSKKFPQLQLRNNKHLMTGPKGNSEFCFPETLDVPRGVEGKQNSLFPVGPVIKCFVIPPNSKIEQIKLTYVSKELRSVLFSSSKLCGKFCSLQNSYKV